MNYKQFLNCLLTITILLFALTNVRAQDNNVQESNPRTGSVHALFDLDRPETGPFPTDIFTVADRSHNTGRRVNLPYP